MAIYKNRFIEQTRIWLLKSSCLNVMYFHMCNITRLSHSCNNLVDSDIVCVQCTYYVKMALVQNILAMHDVWGAHGIIHVQYLPWCILGGAMGRSDKIELVHAILGSKNTRFYIMIL